MSWSAHVRAAAGELQLDVALEGTDDVLGLVGPNGSGKTTLARVLVGAHPLLAGRIVVDGQVVADPAQAIERPPHRRGIGYVPQGSGLFPHLDVRDNVAFGLPSSSRTEADAALAAHGLTHLARRRPAALSGGERQQVALVRALVARPRLLVLDEPMASMDATARRAARARLAERLLDAGVPALVITHDLRDLVALGARCAVLEQGRIVQQGSPQELAARPRTPFVEELVGPDLSAPSRSAPPRHGA